MIQTETLPRATTTPQPVPAEAQLTLADHLEELRRRLGIGLAAFLAAAVLGMTQADRLIEWLQRPADGALGRLVFLSPLEPLQAQLRVAALAGVLLAMPVWLWQLWAFIRPGLKPSERRLGVTVVAWGTAQFALGAASAYWLLLPATLRVVLDLAARSLEPAVSVGRYVAFATSMLWWTGIAFELPVVLWALSRVGVVTPEWLRQQRPYAFLVLVIVAALVTPTTDPVSLLLLAVPLALLYELSVLLTAAGQRSTRRPNEGGPQ
jgi:sec-independent protein translocase protein TatC